MDDRALRLELAQFDIMIAIASVASDPDTVFEDYCILAIAARWQVRYLLQILLTAYSGERKLRIEFKAYIRSIRTTKILDAEAQLDAGAGDLGVEDERLVGWQELLRLLTGEQGEIGDRGFSGVRADRRGGDREQPGA